MIVCHCRVVSAAKIKAAIADGAVSVDCVARRTEAGTECGGCREELHSMLSRAGVECAAGCDDCPRGGVDLSVSRIVEATGSL